MNPSNSETLDSLGLAGRRAVRVHQSRQGYRFNGDSVLLASFTRLKPGMRVLDLGCGDGVVTFLLAGRCSGIKRWVGIDWRAEAIDRAQRSLKLHAHFPEARFEFRVHDWGKPFGKGEVFDVVVSNPPWYEEGRGRKNPNGERAASRHAPKGALEIWARAVKRALRPGGALFVVFRTERLADLLQSLRAHRLEPKRLQLVHDHAEREAKTFLLEARRDGEAGLKVLPPLIVS